MFLPIARIFGLVFEDAHRGRVCVLFIGLKKIEK
jgi:hypothetical protein